MLEALRPLVGFVLRSPAVLFLGCWGLLALFRRRPHLGGWRRSRSWWIVAASAAFVLAAGIAFHVASRPGYDHVGVQIVAVSALLARGEPLYHALDAPVRYSLLYGPLSYLVDDALLAVLPGGERMLVWFHVGLFGAAVALLARTLRRESADWRGVAALAAFLTLLHAFGPLAYSVRTDTLLLVAGVAGLILARGAGPPALRALGLGVVAGLAASAKLHGGLYLAPAAVLLAAQAGWWLLLPAAASALVTALLPFLHPGVGIAPYLSILRAAGGHGLSAYGLATTLATALFLLLPVLAVRAPSPERPRGFTAFVATLVATMTVVSVFAAKPGAGVHHLLPFLPVVVWSWMQVARPMLDAPARARGAVAWLIAGVLFVAGQLGLELRHVALVRSSALPEVESYLERLAPEPIQIGLGDSPESLWLHAPAPRLVLAGHPYWFDPAALFDLGAAGLEPPRSSAELVASCGTRWWLIPRGEQPFALASTYDPHRPLFDETFRETFLAHHERVESGTWYDLWRCRDRAP